MRTHSPDGVHLTVFPIYMPLVNENWGFKNTNVNRPFSKCRKALLSGWVGGWVGSVFFLPEKKKILPEKIFNFLPEKIWNFPRKKFENCPRRENSAREKNSKILPEKKNSLPEKKNRNFPRQKYKKYLKILKFLPEKNKMQPEKKSENLPEKTKCNPRKNLKICPRKLHNARENLGKSGREKYFPPEKKTKKKAKYWFLGHFSFSRVKKKLCQIAYYR